MGVGDGVGVSGGAAVGSARVTVGRGGIVDSDILGVAAATGADVGVSIVTTCPHADNASTIRDPCKVWTKKRRVKRGDTNDRNRSRFMRQIIPHERRVATKARHTWHILEKPNRGGGKRAIGRPIALSPRAAMLQLWDDQLLPSIDGVRIAQVVGLGDHCIRKIVLQSNAEQVLAGFHNVRSCPSWRRR